MPFTNPGKNTMLNALTAVATHASLHTADPGATGASEVTGGSPAYARKPIAFVAAANGSASQSATDPVFDVPGGVTVAHVGYWSALTGGTFYGSAPVTAEAFTGQGTYTLTDTTLSIT